jgi:hypothetical protein
MKTKNKNTFTISKKSFRFLDLYALFFSLLFVPAIGVYCLNALNTMTPINVYADYRKSEAEKVESKASKLEALKGTKMQDAIPHIEKASVYYGLPVELYLGIAFAESSFNTFRPFNPWGIDTGKGNDPRTYLNWEQSVNGFSQLIKYYYWNEGKLTPEQMRDKYVGKGIGSPSWINNVKKFYDPQIEIKL